MKVLSKAKKGRQKLAWWAGISGDTVRKTTIPTKYTLRWTANSLVYRTLPISSVLSQSLPTASLPSQALDVLPPKT
jgi:hypothetical protein